MKTWLKKALSRWKTRITVTRNRDTAIRNFQQSSKVLASLKTLPQ